MAQALTLDVGDSLVEDLLLDLGVLEVLVDLLDQVGSQLLLLALAEVSLVADPRVKGALDLGGNGNLLLQLKGLGLELGSLTRQSKQVLGHIDQVLELTDLVDAALDSRLVVVAGLVQDALDTLYM